MTSADQLKTATPVKRLRWIPFIVLIVLMGLLRISPGFFEERPLPLLMGSLMGPALLGLLMLLWWATFSRAPLTEKLIGFGVSILIMIVGMMTMDSTMQGMGGMIYAIPTACASLGVALSIASGWQSRTRMLFALACFTITFGAWNLVQSEGVDGTFQADLRWRWLKTREQEYLSSLKPAVEQPGEASSSASGNSITQDQIRWAGFRGADRTGRVTGLRIDEDWKSHPPREIWRRKIGPAWSSFSIAGSRLYTQEQRGEKEAVLCIDAETGKDIWSHEYEARFWDGIAGAGPRATPTITPDGIYATGADGAVMRLRPEDGKEVWQHHFKEDAGRAKAPEWGYASSPLVIGNKAIVHAGGKDDKGIIAYNTQDGSIAWTAAAGNHSYSSPQIAEFAGVRGVLMLCNDMLQFVNPEDGKQLWAYPWKVDTYRALQPLVVGTDIYLATPLSSGMHKISVYLVDGQWKVEKQWDTRGLKPDFNDYVELDGMIYGFDSNIFGCIDAATGKRKWKQGRYGNGQVLLIADSKQLLLTSETGELVLLNADPEKLDERAKFPVFTSKTWNHPVLIGNRLYLRNAEEAACLELPVTMTNSADAGDASPPAS